MLFNTTVSVADLAVEQAEDHVSLGLALAIFLPTPQGNIPLPLGVVNIPMSKEVAIQRGKELIAAGEAIEKEPEKKSDLIVAQSLQGVEQAAKMEQQIKGKP